MQLALAYVVFVLVGPAIFSGMIRPAPSRERFLIGAVSACGLMGAAFVLRGLNPATPAAVLGGLFCLWLGWIVTIATAVQAWALARGMGRQRKWSAAIGAAAVTLPWFGLSLAMSAG